MSEQSPSPTLEKSALVSAANFIKFIVALSTGTLVVSGALITNQTSLSPLGVVLLMISWLALALSVLTGVIAYYRIPVKFANQDYDITNDKRLRSTLAISGLMFVTGIITLSLGLSSALFSSGGNRPTPTPTWTLTITSSPSREPSASPTFTGIPAATEATRVSSPTPSP